MNLELVYGEEALRYMFDEGVGVCNIIGVRAREVVAVGEGE